MFQFVIMFTFWSNLFILLFHCVSTRRHVYFPFNSPYTLLTNEKSFINDFSLRSIILCAVVPSWCVGKVFILTFKLYLNQNMCIMCFFPWARFSCQFTCRMLKIDGNSHQICTAYTLHRTLNKWLKSMCWRENPTHNNHKKLNGPKSI